jgi:hypothetical protein
VSGEFTSDVTVSVDWGLESGTEVLPVGVISVFVLLVAGLLTVLLGVGVSAEVLGVGLSVVLFTKGLAGLALRKLFTACNKSVRYIVLK